jgi:hypothetical protein
MLMVMSFISGVSLEQISVDPQLVSVHVQPMLVNIVIRVDQVVAGTLKATFWPISILASSVVIYN